MTKTYDPNNVFARILRGEIPNKTILETDHTLAFYDIAPQTPVHALVIPKGAYTDFAEFAALASAEELVDFHRSTAQVCEMLGLTGPEGFRAITNAGLHGMQDVPHFHLHILGGRVLGRLVERIQ
ncbi:MAG: HIT domain-containing protein [Paracoccaceae bacterium]